MQDCTLTLENESAGDLDRRGTLYILAIGVSKYPNIPGMCKPAPSCDLSYTSNDAIAFADTMEARLGALHERVVRRVLVNGGKVEEAPTAANITDALGILGGAQPNDTVAVFLAGHGFNDGPNYRFVPTDAAIANGTIRPSSVVPWYAIEEAVDGAKGRRLLFIDTCHSAGAYNERLGNSAYYANILAYSSARRDQEALESDALMEVECLSNPVIGRARRDPSRNAIISEHRRENLAVAAITRAHSSIVEADRRSNSADAVTSVAFTIRDAKPPRERSAWR